MSGIDLETNSIIIEIRHISENNLVKMQVAAKPAIWIEGMCHGQQFHKFRESFAIKKKGRTFLLILIIKFMGLQSSEVVLCFGFAMALKVVDTSFGG